MMATVNDLQRLVGEKGEDLRHSKDPKIVLLFLLEELGEVARAFLKEEGHKEDNTRILETFRQEMGDVFFLILRLAYLKNIDLEKQLTHTIDKLQTRSLEET